MAALRVLRPSAQNTVARALILLIVLTGAAPITPDDSTCSLSKPAVGSAMMQIHTGSQVNRPKQAPKPEKSPGMFDASDPDLSEQSDDHEESSEVAEVPSDQNEKKDAHSTAESVVTDSEIEQSEHRNGKKEHTKSGRETPTTKIADVSQLASKLGPHGICKSHPCRLTKLNSKKRGVGNTAGLDEAGYRSVAALKDDAEMAEFVARVIHKCDFKVENMRGMMSVVPWFSGTTAVQSFEALEDALLNAAVSDASEAWLAYRNTAGVSGDSADLGAIGYVQVAALRDGAAMIAYARRLCKQMGVKIVDESAFDSMVESYSGSDGFQSYERLQAEVRSAANAAHTWARWGKRPAVLASTQNALSVDATDFARAAVRVATTGFCKRHPCQSLLAARPELDDIGRQAPLDESGYKQVAHLKDDKEMREFILRVIAMYDCKVVSDGGLSGIVPWFSGTTETQSFEKLEEVLLFAIISDPKHAWLNYRNTARITGDNAALNLSGYVQVAALRKTGEMKKFARRMCKDLGIKIVDEGGFEGTINYYSGSEYFQSYERLVSEIKSAAKAPHSWAAKE